MKKEYYCPKCLVHLIHYENGLCLTSASNEKVLMGNGYDENDFDY